MKYLLMCLILLFLNCSHKQDNKFVIDTKNKTIDSLRFELADCKLQAQIMADILEEERIENNKKK